ncbi:hypothetical protein Bbelb_064920 [Branchiostoma belcheri]|nr:hypothetical protein Bbelb_064920 [Branchiostoma belcheri]
MTAGQDTKVCLKPVSPGQNCHLSSPETFSRYGAYPGGAIGRRGICSFLRARRSCLAASIAVLLGLVAVGLAPLTFSNKQGISQLSTTLKRDNRRLANAVDALKRDQDSMLFGTVDILKRDQEALYQLSTTVGALKRDLDNERNRTASLEQRVYNIEKALRN